MKSNKKMTGREIRPSVNGTTEEDESIFLLLEKPEVCQAIRMADIILVVDRRSGEAVPLWGRRLLQAICDTNQPMEALEVSFKLDFESEEVENLIAAVCLLKGVSVDDVNTEFMSFLQEIA